MTDSQIRIQRLYAPSILMLVISTLLVAAPVRATGAGQTELGAPSGELRIEHEIKIKIPENKTESVWKYLESRYEDPSWLNRTQMSFKSAFGDEDFQDNYFDTPDLQLLECESGIRHRIRTVRSGPAGRKDGRQLLQIKLNRAGECSTTSETSAADLAGLSRSEVKFDVSRKRKNKSSDDSHPFIGLIKRDQREEAREFLDTLGIDANRLKPVITVYQKRRRVYLSDQAGDFATLTLDQCSSNSWLANPTWTEIELELNEIRYTEAGVDERDEMEAVTALIQEDLHKEFPDIEQDQTPKYNQSFERISRTSILPVRQLIRLGVTQADLFTYSLITAAAGILLAIFLLEKQRSRKTQRKLK